MNNDNFVKVTDAQCERLAILAEELGESCQIIGKIIRHGFDNFSPKDQTRETNRQKLQKELGDVINIIVMMSEAGDISQDAIELHALEKRQRITKWLRFQEE